MCMDATEKTNKLCDGDGISIIRVVGGREGKRSRLYNTF